VSNDLHRVLIQIVGEIGKMSALAEKIPQVNTDFFQIYVGLNIALTKIWEVDTGRTPGSAIEMKLKPQEILQWAKNEINRGQSRTMFDETTGKVN
jgi:hypothetical protein